MEIGLFGGLYGGGGGGGRLMVGFVGGTQSIERNLTDEEKTTIRKGLEIYYALRLCFFFPLVLPSTALYLAQGHSPPPPPPSLRLFRQRYALRGRVRDTSPAPGRS